MRAYARMHPQVRDGQRPEDARTAENAGTASDRERRADGNGFPVRSLFLGLAAAVGLAGNAWWYHRAGYAPELFAAAEGVLAILLGIGVAGILRHRSAGQARAGENGKETTEAPESAAAEDAVRIRLAESEKQRPACRVGGNTRGEGNETMQSGGTAGSMQRSGRTGERTPAGT